MVAGCQTCPEPVTLVPVSMISDNFEDGTEVDEIYIEGSFYIRKGRTPEKDCRTSRTEVEEVDDFLMMRLNGVTETCSGKNCSHCAFKDGGGCTCKNIGQGICSHTITKNRDILKLP